jgi:hypothetical protein
MFPFDSPLSTALSFFMFAVQIKDVIYSHDVTDGIDKQSVVPRSMQAAIDPSGGRNMDIDFGGSVADGDIAIITDCVLFMDDIYADGAREKQSFVIYQGKNYRVDAVMDYGPQTGLRAYKAGRHVTQDII